MKIDIKKVRLEISIRNGITASLIMNFFKKDFTILEVYNLNLKDVEDIKEICKYNSIAVINSKNNKLKDICYFKTKYYKDGEITLVDRINDDDDIYGAENYNVKLGQTPIRYKSTSVGMTNATF